MDYNSQMCFLTTVISFAGIDNNLDISQTDWEVKHGGSRAVPFVQSLSDHASVVLFVKALFSSFAASAALIWEAFLAAWSCCFCSCSYWPPSILNLCQLPLCSANRAPPCAVTLAKAGGCLYANLGSHGSNTKMAINCMTAHTVMPATGSHVKLLA